MTTLEIIGLLLTSSVISAGLTAFINWRIQIRNYRFEYYKKLLEKRLEAYENVEELISSLNTVVIVGKGRTCNLFFTFGLEGFDKFILALPYVMKKSFWVSHEITGKITELNVLLIEIDNQINRTGDVKEQLVDLGSLNRERIREIKDSIQELLYKDFKTLHKIDKFVNEPRPDKEYAIHGKPKPKGIDG